MFACSPTNIDGKKVRREGRSIMHTFQITIFIKSARYFVPKTKTVVIYKTTHQSGLRKHPKDTILVQMRGENKRKKERKASKCYPSLSFESVYRN